MSSSGDLIYLDYAATTPVDDRVAERMLAVRQSAWFNPTSNHPGGRVAAARVDEAAAQTGSLLNVSPDTLVWTSGATESNNLAILGVAKQRAHRGKHLVTMRTEHKAVVDVFKALEKQGFDVCWLDPSADGRLDMGVFESSLKDDTQLVSIMHINNETGVVQDVESIGDICRARGIAFHVDGAQAAGKVRLDIASLPIDLMSLTAHKFYGPKGIGALYIADGLALEAQLFGGGQQRRLRPGTLAVDLIAGMGEAASVASERIDEDLAHHRLLRERLWSGLQRVDGLLLNGQQDGGYPGILNVSVPDVEGESLLLALEPLCVATGSACNSQNREPSYVLRALGRNDLEAQGSIRFSLGRSTTEREIDVAVASFVAAVTRLRRLAPGDAA